MKLAERLTDSEAKVRVLTLFHEHPREQLSLQEILNALLFPEARRADLVPVQDVREALEDLSQLGLLRAEPTYFLIEDRDREIQEELIRELETDRAEAEKATWTRVRRTLGVALLDSMVEDSFPAPVSLLVLADPECSPGVLFQQLAAGALAQGHRVIYATTEEEPPEIEAAVSDMIGGPSEPVLLLDMFSPLGEMSSPTEFSVHPRNLTDVSISVSDLLDRDPILVLLDSCSTLVDLSGYDAALQFVKSLAVRCKRKGCSLIFTLNRKAYETAVLARFQALTEGVIELKADEDPIMGIITSLRISKLAGTRFSSKWTEYKASPGVGIEGWTDIGV
ncbi:MAG: ATPase domain-containing protein [Candidatus Geothermarchaeales archaeon]